MSLLDLDKSKQLSLFDANLNSASKGDDVQLPPIKKTKSNAPSFLTLSATVHALCFLMISALSIPLITKEAPELIQFELEEPLQSAFPSLGENVPATQGSASAATSESPSQPAPEESLPEKSLPPKVAATPKAALPITQSPPFAAMPETAQAVQQVATQEPLKLPELETPELDGLKEAQTLTATPVASRISHENIENGLEQDLMNQAPPQEMPAAFALEQENSELESMQAIQDLQARENAEIANLKASAQQSAESAALAQKVASTANSSGAIAGEGQGNNGENKPSKVLAGTPTGVRSLDQLRQMPNNPKPYYDREERRRGDQGTVKFVAFINKLGKPENFKLIQSSGYANLDQKTLAALKNWRFHPGQEGWVELPFKWDLQGGVQEDGGFLRRVGSR
ncbi:hypothetical protein BDW_13765 [Bdellovibrio bacteriovorus W]|nr:hypothetical protein BDW_13765 [Bdellovibrio bacteriovorus W]